ncbi:MAG: elongation factor P [Candidatus Krumholzibacteria bacterium]|nr:elongation factor P [Candidatus Krumholzibacteria bacterium]
MADTSDFRSGMILRIDGKLYAIVEFQHVKVQQRRPIVRTRLKQVPEGYVLEKTFMAGDKVEEVRVERRQCQYLYNSGDLYYLMDVSSFEQMPVSRSIVEPALPYLVENMNVTLLADGDRPIAIELPHIVELAVKETEPGVRGDTAQGGSKNATVETGTVINVPLFIGVGDVIRIDTRTGRYIERA